MTIQHNVIPEAQLHEPKGISLADSGQILVADGAGSGAWADPASGPSDTVYVNDLTDFPTPVSGLITLASNTRYVLGADVFTADRFILGENNAITANNINGAVLTYTGTGDMFTGVDVFFDIQNITLDAATASQVFNISELGAGNTKVVTMDTVAVTNCLKFGTFDNLLSLDISNVNSINAATGIEAKGTGWLAFSLTKFALITTSATFIGVDFGTSTQQNVELSNLLFVAPSGAIGLKGLVSSGNIVANNLATVADSSFLGALTPLSTITTSDIRWEFRNNAGISDSAKAVDTYLNASTTVTIGTQSQFEPIGGANFLSTTALRFTVDTAGIATYVSEVDTCFLVNATATVEKVGGGADVIAVRIAKNGTDILATQSQTQSADPTSVSCTGIVELTAGETISIEVANNGSTSNIIVSTAAMVVTGVK